MRPLLPPQSDLPRGALLRERRADDAATKKARRRMTSALAAAGAQPDMITISAWDPALLLVTALRELGPDATAHASCATISLKLKGWIGANGPYDFSSESAARRRRGQRRHGALGCRKARRSP